MRRIGLGTLALLLIAASEPKPDSKAKAPETQAAQEQRGTEKAPLIVEARPAPKTPDETAADKREANRQRDNDARSFGLNIALILVGALQLGVFGYQALKLRQTVKEGKDAIGAAIRAANASEKYAEAVILGEQPYLFPDVPDMTHFLPDASARRYGPSDKTPPPAVGLAFVNLGKSTCVIRAQRIEISIGEAIPPVPTFAYAKEIIGETLAKADTNIGMAAYYYDRHLTPEERGGIFRGEIPVNVFGYVVYADIFGARHKKGFCIRSKREQVFDGSWQWRANVVGGAAYNYRKRTKGSANFRV